MSRKNCERCVLIGAVLVAALFVLTVAVLASPYKPIDVKTYLESLPIPGTKASCCGVADAYKVETLERCKPEDFKFASSQGYVCAFVAILDKQPKEWLQYQATHYPEGYRIVVTRDRLRKPPIPNPLGFPIVFTNNSMDGRAICFEPNAMG